MLEKVMYGKGNDEGVSEGRRGKEDMERKSENRLKGARIHDVEVMLD